MPSYTTLPHSSRTRLLRVDKHDPEETGATVVTTLSGTGGRALAAALTAAIGDIPGAYTLFVLEQCGDTDLLPMGYDGNAWEDADQDWQDLPASTAPFSLRRRVLNALDAPTGTTHPGLHPVDHLRDVLAAQPESVRRAVRDQVERELAPYEGVPVIARVYDHKWGECDTVLLANAALAALTEQQLDRISPWDAMAVTHVMDRHGLTDLEFAARTWDQGFLSVVLNQAQFAAWRAARP